MRIRGNVKTFVVNTTISYNLFHKLLDVIEEMRVNNHGAYFITLIKGNQEMGLTNEYACCKRTWEPRAKIGDHFSGGKGKSLPTKRWNKNVGAYFQLMLRQTMTFFMSLCQLSGWKRLFKYCRSPYKCERSWTWSWNVGKNKNILRTV